MAHSFGRALKFYVGQYLPEWRALRPLSIATYRTALGQFGDYVKRRLRRDSVYRIRLDEIRPEHVMGFLQQLSEGRTGPPCVAATLNLKLEAIKGFYRGCAAMDPRYQRLAERMALIPRRRASVPRPDYLTLTELQAIFEATDLSTKRGYRDATLLLLAYTTGARASEVTTLRMEDMMLDGGYRHVRIHGKGGRVRTPPLWDGTAVLLRHYVTHLRPVPADGQEPWVFLNARRRRLTRKGLHRLVRAYARTAARRMPSLQHKRISPHSLRRTIAVHLLQAGVDETTIRAWLGHVRMETTARYLQLSPDDCRNALEKFCALERVLPTSLLQQTRRRAPLDEAQRWLENR